MRKLSPDKGGAMDSAPVARAPRRARIPAEQARDICATLLGAAPEAVEWPGGRSRRSVRVRFAPGVHGADTLIITRRRSKERARLEAHVLKALRGAGAPVPRLLAFDGEWLVQEDLGDRRLSQAVAGAPPALAEAWVLAALASLAAVQRAGRSLGLAKNIATIGAKPDWLRRLIATPARLGEHLAMPAPALDVTALASRLAVRRATFIKWDARPGNAAATTPRRVHWFDWEHCACRNALDDAVWLLGDEYCPDLGASEEDILHEAWRMLGPDEPEADGLRYMACYGPFHMANRLALIVENKGDGGWRRGRAGLDHDKIGVFQAGAVGLCRRAARWSAMAGETAPLAAWFDRLAEHFKGMA